MKFDKLPVLVFSIISDNYIIWLKQHIMEFSFDSFKYLRYAVMSRTSPVKVAMGCCVFF